MTQNNLLTRQLKGEWVEPKNKQKAENLVGFEKFDIFSKSIQNFGKIKNISPMFFIKNDEIFIKKVDIDSFDFEDGVLKGYLQDAMNARLMKTKRTGNGRRESYAHLPMPRMTNTYMLGGQHAPEEIIASVKRGIYAPGFSGGQVDITSGKFVFSTSEAYLIENGKITTPIKGATLIGNGPDALTKIKMIGNDMALDSGVGTCGKDGQSVPVGVGQPTLRIDGLTVGGAQL